VSVRYNVDSQTVTFQSPSTSSEPLCVRVRLLSASSSLWTSQRHCTAVDSGSVLLTGDVHSVSSLEMSFCVQRRLDVCGQAQNATIGQLMFYVPCSGMAFTAP